MANSTSKNYTNKINTYMEYSELHNVIKQHLGQRLQNNELSNEDMTSLIDLIAGYLNLQTISDYSKSKKISYNGVLERIKSGKLKEYVLFNVKFVIDNE
jgi:hypothetical protein